MPLSLEKFHKLNVSVPLLFLVSFHFSRYILQSIKICSKHVQSQHVGLRKGQSIQGQQEFLFP